MQSENIELITKAIISFQKEVSGIKKESENPYFKSKYANLESIWMGIKDGLFAHDLTVIQYGFPSKPGTIGVGTKLLHTSGQWIDSQLELPFKEPDPQKAGAAITYSRRYSLAAILSIPLLDDDAESAMVRDKSPYRSFKDNFQGLCFEHNINEGALYDAIKRDPPNERTSVQELRQIYTEAYNYVKREAA